jgi:hypothetical protein
VGSENAETGSKAHGEESGKHTGVKLSKIHVPSNLREAQRSPQWEYWKAAMQEEQNSLDAHDVCNDPSAKGPLGIRSASSR